MDGWLQQEEFKQVDTYNQKKRPRIKPARIHEYGLAKNHLCELTGFGFDRSLQL
jgi:hypothetical protein